LWEFAAAQEEPTLVLEDDVHIGFDRNGDKGKMTPGGSHQFRCDLFGLKWLERWQFQTLEGG